MPKEPSLLRRSARGKLEWAGIAGRHVHVYVILSKYKCSAAGDGGGATRSSAWLVLAQAGAASHLISRRHTGRDRETTTTPARKLARPASSTNA